MEVDQTHSHAAMSDGTATTATAPPAPEQDASQRSRPATSQSHPMSDAKQGGTPANASSAAAAPMAGAPNATPASGGAAAAAASQSKTDDKTMADGSGLPFHCEAESTDALITLLSTLMLEKDQRVSMAIIEAGLKFCVEKGKTLTAKAYLKASNFSKYDVTAENIELLLPLAPLVQCLQIFCASAGPATGGRDFKKPGSGGGGSHWNEDRSEAQPQHQPSNRTHITMEYRGAGHPLELLLEEEGVITQCQIHTLSPSDSGTDAMADLNFRAAGIAARAMMKSSLLRECFNDIDSPGATSVTLTLCPVSPFLTLTSTTPAGLCKVDFPIASDPTNSAIFQEFECKEKISNEYPMQLIRMCAKAMQRSQTTSMRFNQNGVLSLQAVIPSADPKQANWVEFVVAPLDQSTAADGARDELERIKRESQQNQKQAEFM